MIHPRRLVIAVAAAAGLFAGTVLAADGPLQIRRISPSGQNVTPGQELVIQFDRTMTRLGNMAVASDQEFVRVSPDPGCEWRWLDTTELACRLAKQQTFRPATQYTVKVGVTLKALDGSRLAAPVIRTFTTELPEVEHARFKRWLSPVEPRFMLRFNMPVRAAAVEQHVRFATQGGSVPVKAAPYTKKRKGPLWLPVPGVPGALLKIKSPEPSAPLDVDQPTGQARRVWLVSPTRNLRADSQYHLLLTAGLTSPLGALPSERRNIESARRIQTYGVLAFRGVHCELLPKHSYGYIHPGDESPSRCRPDTVGLAFSAPVTLETLAAVKWAPQPPVSLAEHWEGYPPWFLRARRNPNDAATPDTYPLRLTLDPMTDYTLTVPACVKDRFGRRLDESAVVHFRTGHRRPFLHLPPLPAILESGEQTVAPLRFTNLDALSLDVHRLIPSDLGAATIRLDESRHINLLGRPPLDVRPDRVVHEPIGVRSLLDSGSGVLWGHFRWRFGGHDRHARALMEVTPYQVFAKLGHYNSLVWISTLKGGRPVPGAKVRLLTGPRDTPGPLTNAAGGVVATDADGLAVLPGTDELGKAWLRRWGDEASSFYVSIVKGQKMALLPLDSSFKRWVGSASHNSFWANQRPRHGHIRVWAISSQGIYKPGSEIKFAVFVRAQNNATLVAAPRLDYTLKVTNPTGQVVLKQAHLKPGPFGDFDARMRVGANAPTGRYQVSMAWPTSTGTMVRQAGSFMVTDFVPASFKVETLLDGDRFGPGDSLHASVAARLHAGGPYTDAEVRVTTKLVRQRFAPDNPVASGFRFGGVETDAPSVVGVDRTEARLDQQGDANVTIALPAEVRFDYGVIHVEAAVQSARGTQVANSQQAMYAARDRYIGLRTDAWLQRAGQPFGVEYLVVDPAGMPQAGAPVTLLLQRQVVNRVRSKNAAGDFVPRQSMSWETEDQCMAVSAATPGDCKLTPQHPGRYRVLASVVDTHQRVQKSVLTTWVTGAGQVLWSQGKAVTLVPDRSNYHVGDTAHILVQNPFPGAHALVTVERYGILWKRRLTLKGGAPVIDVPITRSMFPGAYLAVTVFSPRVGPPADPDLGKPEVAMGYVALNVRGHGSALKVSVVPDGSVFKPRETVHATVRLRSRSGHSPGRTRVVVAVVDQGVLDLLPKGIKTYDPLAYFYAPPSAPDISNYSLVSRLLTRLQSKSGKGLSPGGGGGESAGPNVRSQFKSAIYWNASLVTGLDGRVQFHFKLPDNLTRWRIIAVAMTPGDAMGWGVGSVRVNLPVQVQPALPNQVHVGDRFDAGFSITNRTDKPRQITTNLVATGPIQSGKTHAGGTLALDPFAHGLAWLPIETTGTGTIRFMASAKTGDLGDAVTTSIPVRRAGATEVAAEYGSFTAGSRKVPLSVPADALPGSTQLRVSLAPTLLGGLDGAFATLRDNPLHTWEIRLSRAVLAADYLQLKPVLGASFSWSDARDDVKDMLAHAIDYQAPNGGMAFWIPRNDFVSPYLSVYTALAFDWLRSAGYEPPVRVATRLRSYLQSHILEASAAGNRSVAAILQAGAMAALAPHGKLVRGAVAGMLPKLARLDLFGQALLLEAALDTQDFPSAKVILKSLLSRAEESGGEISFNEPRRGFYMQLLATPLRANCAVLDALVKYKRDLGDGGLLGETPQKLMRWVIGQRRNAGGWPNSQENVFCTTAIVHYADGYEASVHELGGRVRLDGEAVGKRKFSSRRTPAQVLTPSLAHSSSTGNSAVTVEHTGQGRLYYNVRLSYAMPPGALGAADAGISISRAYAVEEGGRWRPVVDGTKLERGDIVRVSLDVSVPTERHHVVVTDPLPGAFQAVNRQLATAMEASPHHQPGVAVLMFDGGAWPNMAIVHGGFYHRETDFDAVRFFADDLPPGRYRLVYSAQVISRGRFIAPAPEAHEIYQPDVFGRGEVQRILVGPQSRN